MGCGAAEATGLGFVCFAVINPRVLSTHRVDLGFFLFHKFPIYPPPPGKKPVEIYEMLETTSPQLRAQSDDSNVRTAGGVGRDYGAPPHWVLF